VSAEAPPPLKRLELTALAGWQVSSDIHLGSGRLTFDGAPVFGVVIASEVMPGAFAELRWTFSDPEVHAAGTSLLDGSAAFHVQSHYFQVGGTQSFRRGRTSLYAGATVGAVLFAPSSLDFSNGTSAALSDTWAFAFTLEGGVKVELHPKVALRFEVNVAAPVYFSSGTLYVGGGQAGLTVSGGVPLWQWNFMGGLAFAP
jgi:hypothetical protein